MQKQFFILILATLSFLTSCKKDNDKPGPVNPSGKVLKRIVETENNSTTTYTFSYDANKRLSSVVSTNNEEATFFTYDDKGNVIKLENRIDDETNLFIFTYTNNLPVSGTFKSFERSGTEEIITDRYDLFYTVTGGVVSKIKAVMMDPQNNQETYQVVYDLQYTNGNVTKIASVDWIPYSATFTYGNKKPVYPQVFPYVLDPAGFSAQFSARNELLSLAYDFSGTELDQVITTTYTYDAEGYVLTATDGTTSSRFEYE